MNKVVCLENATFVTGATSTGSFLISKVNYKNVGIPLYTFDWTFPEMEFLPPTQLKLDNGTFSDTATSYVINGGPVIGERIAIAIQSSTTSIELSSDTFAFPIYRINEIDNNCELKFETATLVSGLTSTGYFYVLNVNGTQYGIPCYMYNTQYPFTSSSEQSAIDIETQIVVTPVLNSDRSIKTFKGSTNLNSKIKTYADLIRRIKSSLGHPIINIEICDDQQMVDFIDIAIEWYTKYAGYTEEYLVFNSSLYEEPGLRIDKLFSITPTLRANSAYGNISWDYDLEDYRKVIGIFEFKQGETTGINTLFTLEQAMAQQTYFSYMLGNAGFDLVTWEVLKGWLKQREKMLAQTPYIDFDNRNQLLRIIPPPTANSRYLGVVGCWVERAIKDVIMERWVYQYSLALTKIALGNIRGKYSSMTLFGGGNLNYNDLLTEGKAEKEKLELELMNGTGESPCARFFIG